MPISGQSMDLFNSFGEGWQKQWKKKFFTRKQSLIETADEEGNQSLKIISDNTATGMWRKIKNPVKPKTTLSWKWKTKKLINNSAEMEKRGDDYVGRIYVVFGNYTFLTRFRAKVICYVWASEGQPETYYSSPYAKNVKIIVLRNKSDQINRWYEESRNVLEDYRRVFGENPPLISAIGVMADTDNSDMMCTSWFDELKIDP